MGSSNEEDAADSMDPGGKPPEGGLELLTRRKQEQFPAEGAPLAPTASQSEEKDTAETRKRKRLEQAGIKIMPAAQRFARLGLPAKGWPGWRCACPECGMGLA